MSRQRMNAGDRKRAIVKAALPLFARKGFAETTTKDLAKAAGVSEPLLYKHFPSKEAFYLAIQNHSCEGFDPVIEKLRALEPSTATLVRLVYHLMRAMLLGRPAGLVEWDTRHRLMLNSVLDDGTYARLLYKNRFDDFCAQIEESLKVALAKKDVVQSPLKPGNRARFAHHLAAWLVVVHLPETPVIDYRMSRRELMDQAMLFALRGMGMTDKAIAKHYDARPLEEFFVKLGI